jgi:uncharacterized protein
MDSNTPQIITEQQAPAAAASLVAQKPVEKTERISTIDMIRGVALFGILLMNIPGFGFHWFGYDGLRRGPQSGADYYTMEVISVFFEGTMRGLFSMLFGAGMLLFTMNKKDSISGPSVGELYYRRLLILVGFGVINAFVFLWIGDILFFYGLCGMVLYPFRKTAAKWLLVMGICFLAVAAWKSQIWYGDTREQRAKYNEAKAAEKAGKKLTDEQTAAIASWTERENWKPDPQDRDRDVREVRGNYASVFSHYLRQNAEGEIWGTYHWAIWDCLGMMFLGMALFKLGYFSNKPSTSTYLMGLLVGYGVGIPVGYAIFSKEMIESVRNYGAFVDNYRVSFNALYDLKRVLLSVGHASLIMLVYRSRLVPWLMKGLANVGQMAFTNYLMQSLICTFIFHGYGLGYYNKLAFHQLYYVVFGVWVFQFIFSAIWLRYFRFGPFEWLWRSMTYWKKQPMRVKEEAVVA